MSGDNLSDEAFAQELERLESFLVSVLDGGADDRVEALLDLLAGTIDPAAMVMHYWDQGAMKRAVAGELARQEPEMYVWYREPNRNVPDYPPTP